MYTNNTQKGFTLVETLVAILILTLSISGPLFIAQQSVTSANVARDQTTARFLGQEGLEVIRALRDDNYLSGRSWLSGLAQCDHSQGGCMVDITEDRDDRVVGSCGPECDPLRFDERSGIYNHNGVTGDNVITTFRRRVIVEEITPGNGVPDAEILVEVTWNDRGTTRNVTTEGYIFDWL